MGRARVPVQTWHVPVRHIPVLMRQGELPMAPALAGPARHAMPAQRHASAAQCRANAAQCHASAAQCLRRGEAEALKLRADGLEGRFRRAPLSCQRRTRHGCCFVVAASGCAVNDGTMHAA